jgi:hypothetical protein
MVVHICNPSAQELTQEKDGFEASLSHKIKLCLKSQKIERKKKEKEIESKQVSRKNSYSKHSVGFSY